MQEPLPNKPVAPEIKYIGATETMLRNALRCDCPPYDRVRIPRAAVQAPLYRRVDSRCPDVTVTLDIDAITTDDVRPFGAWGCIEQELSWYQTVDDDPITVSKQASRQMQGSLRDDDVVLRPTEYDPLELTVTTPVSELLVEYYPDGEVLYSLAFALPAHVVDQTNDEVPALPETPAIIRMKETFLDETRFDELKLVAMKQWEEFRKAQPSDGECYESLPIRLLPSDSFSGR